MDGGKAVGMVIFVLLLAWMTTGLAHSAPVQAGAPKVEFKETSRDFGRIKQGEVVSHEFTFRNSGKGILVVKNVSTSCGCTAALVSQKELSPGQEGKIKVSFDSRGYAGKVIKYIYLESNDPSRPRQELTITAEVETGPAPRIELEPYNLDLGLALEGEASEAVIKVKNSGQLELVFDIDNPGFTFMVGNKVIGFPYKVPAGKEIMLRALVPVREGRTGTQREYVLIKSNDPARPSLSVFISRYVVTREELRRLFEKYGKELGIK
ncbi:MAG: DUF1573 domain-containing protein [Candidatus Aminicenantes bacterium]|uniref:DUF1573 domain-containing protein n=1 Tax=Candidatus Saccharicenans subterraneus TaxID=2508984 RepID=A0A3E2BQ33_9BACT|nr:DUF1573 domain-containing protein [Candidatus Aminicenantes bacterium]RFT16890.1 MAG: hypothetical protein OP8BY_0832 [Candidatus Saccharicenans subterraneum]